ncbi:MULTISPECIES: monovalent cation/H(+) antiporter subunit G [unclassified Azospirillum]|uniref:monovalent cation/H(+) antiporter subunit G n=1 Tax=unclassified Azospirillum TaxID=2630922 RepID=UPI000D61B14C|nr:monovalent cation/H(+) antiporter subunit G [Azospirillum sp. TSA6c]PWC46344.1 cation:proton antiporter [Azospirillum sp. TSA6c]
MNNHLADLPAWAAIPAALLLLAGAVLTLIGTVGLLRFGSFYQRVHAPTLGSTLGIGCILLASMLVFSVLESRAILHEVLITALMVVTTPITLMLLARAALYRDRSEGSDEVPPPPSGQDARTSGSAPQSQPGLGGGQDV